MRTSFLSNDTICAIATAQGTAAIAVVRLSGSQSHEIACRLFYRQGKPFLRDEIKGFRSFFGNIVVPSKDDEVLD